MKLIYIADNRCRPNFGCRGTSIALSQLIQAEHSIVSSVKGTYTLWESGSIFFVPGMPTLFYKILANFPAWNFFKKIWCRLIFWNKKNHNFFDFICSDPHKSLKRLYRCLPANSHLAELDFRKKNFDGVIINGEGTLIMTTPARRDSLIFIMLMAQVYQLGKKIFLVNAMFSDCPVTGSNTKMRESLYEYLKKCSAVTVRDPASLKYAVKYFSDVSVKYIPDALFTWKRYINDLEFIKNGRLILPFGQESDNDFEKFDFSEPYICISGSSLSAWNQKSAFLAYKRLVEAIKERFDLQIYLLQVCSGDAFLIDVGKATATPCLEVKISILAGAKILSDAALYISGRFHPSIMASLGGTPCIFLGSNSHKTKSLQEMLGYEDIVEFSANPTKKEIPKILKLIKEKIDSGKFLRKKILKTVDNLCLKAENVKKIIH